MFSMIQSTILSTYVCVAQVEGNNTLGLDMDFKLRDTAICRMDGTWYVYSYDVACSFSLILFMADER